MTTETMTIRAALREKKKLDLRIADESGQLYPIRYYTNDNKFIGSMNPEECKKDIISRFQKINDLLKRREAINKAILDINAKAVIRVKKFITFDKLGYGGDDVEYEEISLANAINRKAYYRNEVLKMLNDLKKKSVAAARDFNTKTESVNNAVENEVNAMFQSMADIKNSSMARNTEAYREAFDKKLESKRPILIDPLKAEQVIEKYRDYVSDYLVNIDNELSNKTETISITIEY